MCFNFVLYYPRLPQLDLCVGVDVGNSTDQLMTLCGNSEDIARASGNGTEPTTASEQMAEGLRLIEAGFLQQSTVPANLTRYVAPGCRHATTPVASTSQS